MTIGRIPSVEGGIQPTIVDAKGDLIAGIAADSVNRLAVGSNDQVLVADSSTSTGLAWKSVATPFAAGKNKFINGDFNVNQRGFSSTTAFGYTFDRWLANVNGTCTYSAQTFTPGSAPVAGYEGRNFIQLATSGQGANNYANLDQRIEDVRTFAGQTITISFWARAASGTPKISVYIGQNFGTGGSADVYVYGSAPTITTSWVRYSFNINVPSISGKTIGANSFLTIGLAASDFFNPNLGAQNATISFWGAQVEAGSVATPFTTATGTLQGELAACQRYYNRFTLDGPFDFINSYGYTANTTTAFILIPFPVQMRAGTPILDFAGNLLVKDMTGGSFPITTPFFTANGTSGKNGNINAISSGMTGGRYAQIQGNNDATAYIGFSREL